MHLHSHFISYKLEQKHLSYVEPYLNRAIASTAAPFIFAAAVEFNLFQLNVEKNSKLSYFLPFIDNITVADTEVLLRFTKAL